MAIKKSELYSSLWKSCDELRGGMDASQYKDYVLVLLFVKYVSDKYAGLADAVIEVPEGGSFQDAIYTLPKSIKQNKEAVAETIENNLRKVIIDQQPTNPKYFEKMSALLDELIQARKAAAQDYKAYLQKIVELSKQVTQPSRASEYPQSLNSPAKRALYDNLNQNKELSLAIDDAIRRTKKDGWRGNRIKEREVKNAIKKHLDSPEDCDSEALLRSPLALPKAS